MFLGIRPDCSRIGGFPGKLNLCGTLIIPFGKRIFLRIGLGYLEMKRGEVFRIGSGTARLF